MAFCGCEWKIMDKLQAEVKPGLDHQAQSLEYLGSLYLKDDSFIDLAISTLKKSIKMNEKLDEADNDALFRLLHKLSDAQAKGGKHKEALKSLERALILAKEENGKISREYARYFLPLLYFHG